jgi:hypothetical protein
MGTPHTIGTRRRATLSCGDLQWSVVDCQQLEAGSDLSAAHDGGDRATQEPKVGERKAHQNGFVFIRKANDRRLQMLTARDSYSCELQSFSPYKR